MEIIKKTSEPQCLIDIKKKIPSPYKSDDWENININRNRHNLRIHILENEQNLRCAYCGKILHSDNSETDSKRDNHIDHFIKRELDSSLTFDYNNLFVSCMSNEHCANYKDNKLKFLRNKQEALSINQQLIKPTENITDYIFYNLDGFPHAKGSESDISRAEKTIYYFNLDCEELRYRKTSIIIPLLKSLIGIKTDSEFEKFTSINNEELEKLPTDYKFCILPVMKNIKGNLELIIKFINNIIHEANIQFVLKKQV